MTAREYRPKTYHQAATVTLETAVAEAVAVLRKSRHAEVSQLGPSDFYWRRRSTDEVCRMQADAEAILLAAGQSAELLLARSAS